MGSSVVVVVVNGLFGLGRLRLVILDLVGSLVDVACVGWVGGGCLWIGRLVLLSFISFCVVEISFEISPFSCSGNGESVLPDFKL